MPLRFKKQLVADERYESAGVFDVNNDGILDIVSGAWWYEGTDFRKKHRVGDLMPYGAYFDDFSTIPLDVNGDGRTDFITGGWWGKTLRWRENPGDPDREWPEHTIAETGNIETTRAWDVDRDGQLEIVPNVPGGPLVIYKLITDNSGRTRGEFQASKIFDGLQGHGLGFGDISGKGRGDFVLAGGWLEAPENPYEGKWIFHEDFNLGSASIPILVADVNGDGLNDIIVGQSHGYGLSWYEQQRTATGLRRWFEHPIDPFNSQYHDMHWVDIDNDGECEIVTGKRYRAHDDNDPGAFDDYGIYYFKWNGRSFSKQVIIYGPPRESTGIGIFSTVADLNGDGRLDLVAPGKDGLYVFWNQGI
ncbi:MAG: VCBS repeat-containing protein [Candidatus Omnitrophota bacterium]